MIVTKGQIEKIHELTRDLKDSKIVHIRFNSRGFLIAEFMDPDAEKEGRTVIATLDFYGDVEELKQG